MKWIGYDRSSSESSSSVMNWTMQHCVYEASRCMPAVQFFFFALRL